MDQSGKSNTISFFFLPQLLTRQRDKLYCARLLLSDGANLGGLANDVPSLRESTHN